MEDSISIDEVLKFAVSREVEAYQLYQYMARQMQSPRLRQMCEELAEEELEHKDKLELEVMKTGRVVSDFSCSDYIDDVPEELDMDYKQLLAFAIEKEATSVRLYLDLARIVRGIETCQALLTLADEETEHRRRFETEYNALREEH